MLVPVYFNIIVVVPAKICEREVHAVIVEPHDIMLILHVTKSFLPFYRACFMFPSEVESSTAGLQAASLPGRRSPDNAVRYRHFGHFVLGRGGTKA